MSKVLVDDSSLNSIGSAIRSKNGSNTGYKPSEMAAAINALEMGITPTGTVNISQNGTVNVTQYASAAVNVPNSYAAGDEGKVVSNGALVAQTARSSQITSNGTYDTTLNNSITVNVSGSGGGSVPTFLQNSVSADILVNEYYTNYDDITTSWGDLIITGTPTLRASGVKTARGNGFSYDLGEDNHDVTIYAIAKGYTGGDCFALGTSYALSSGNTIAFFVRESSGFKWYAGVWGSDTAMNVSSFEDYAVMTIAIDCTAKKAYYYFNGNYVVEKSFSNSGAIVRFNGSNSYTDRAGKNDYLFVGVVDGCEPSSTILANQQDMLSLISSGRILTPQ